VDSAVIQVAIQDQGQNDQSRLMILPSPDLGQVYFMPSKHGESLKNYKFLYEYVLLTFLKI